MRILLMILGLFAILYAKEFAYRTYTLSNDTSLFLALEGEQFVFAGIKGTTNEICLLNGQTDYSERGEEAPKEGQLRCGESLKAHFVQGKLKTITWQNRSISPTPSEFRVQLAKFSHTLRKDISLTLNVLCSPNPNIQAIFNTLYGEKYQCATMQKTFRNTAKESLGNAFEKDEQYEANILFNIAYFDNERIVVREMDYLYTGGAHGMSVAIFRTFLISSGQEIDYFTMLAPTKLPALKQRLWKEVQKYGDSVLTNFDEFTISKNIALTYGGILFVYQPYEILPYSFGVPKLLLRYDEASQYFESSVK